MADNKTTEFVSIGFDVKTWPWDGSMTPDETGWDQNYEVREKLEREFSVIENEYQVLIVDDFNGFIEVIRVVEKRLDVNILVVRFPKNKVLEHDMRYGYTTSETNFDLTGFYFRGYDVCDFDGLFSVLFHPGLDIEKNEHGLISDLNHAIALTEIADKVNVMHRPHVVAEILTLK